MPVQTAPPRLQILHAPMGESKGLLLQSAPNPIRKSLPTVCWSLPGVIDAQVHFRDPGNTHKEDLASGSRAAVKGGVTSFLEMPNTNPTTTNQQALDAKLARAARVSVANYGFFIGATPENLDDINTVEPACGIKIFMGSSTGTLLVSEEEDLDRIFQKRNSPDCGAC